MSKTAIRLSMTKDVENALEQAKKLYPTLSYPEILKLGLSKIVTNSSHEAGEIRKMSAHAVGVDYLNDPDEDIYTENVGEKVQ